MAKAREIGWLLPQLLPALQELTVLGDQSLTSPFELLQLGPGPAGVPVDDLALVALADDRELLRVG
jgi:hypothetical protein